MKSQKISQFLEKLEKLSTELDGLVKNDDHLAFVIIATDASYRSPIQFVSSSGNGHNLSRAVFSLLALQEQKDFIRHAIEMYNCFEEENRHKKSAICPLPHDDNNIS